MNPIVVVVNNSGWGIFRPVTERQDLLDIPAWPYAELGRAWGGLGLVATTRAELRAALAEAFASPKFSIVEAITPRDDLSPVTRRYMGTG